MMTAFLWCFGSPGAAVRWLALSREIVSGYAEACSLVGSAGVVVAAVAILLVLVLFGVLERRTSLTTVLYVMVAPTLLVTFRLAFVRQDSHELQFFGYALGVVSAAALSSAGRRRRAILVAVFSGILAVGWWAAGRHGLSTAPGIWRTVSGQRGIGNLTRVVRLDRTRERIAQRSDENLGRLRLPESLVRDLRSGGGDVGVIPWEILLCPANGLPWNPTPTLQLYATYTERLDGFSAAHYASDRAPAVILDQMVPDGILRHRMIDAPATWREIFLRYEPRWVLPSWRMVALERRSEPIHESWRTVSEVAASIDTTVVVPSVRGLLFAFVELRSTLWGRVQRVLFRIPPVYMVVRHASGADTAYRLIPGTAAGGVVVNRLPAQLEGYLALWSGAEVDEVVEMTITGPGAFLFKSPFRVTWRELTTVRSDGPTQPSQ
jgi:hypothetical protein